MRKRWSIIVFAILALLMVITVSTYQIVHAASSTAGATKIQGGSIHLSDATKQNVTTASPSKVLASNEEGQTCFKATVTVSKTGTKTNTFSAYGDIQYFCQAYRNGGGITITNTVLCPGVGSYTLSSYAAFSSGISKGSHNWSYLAPFTGFCEICTNHKPTAFPFFTITTSTSAVTFQAAAGENVNNPSSYTESVDGSSKPITTGFANSSKYQLPCP